MVYYRKYRPQTIGELDKADIRERLRTILRSGHLPHAFLFTGPKGTGKTSTARIIAKTVNCQLGIAADRKPVEPCNVCSNCIAIAKSNHVDVYEIDAASNRGIDEIRELREKISLAPAMGGKKVYIIDEVHMLTREAFNALLKTLEEPPSHVMFILATTEIHKLPDTIVSRCIQLTFTKATPEELVYSLNRIVTGEKLRLDQQLLALIAERVDGSFRDAAKLLEQAVHEDLLTKEGITKLLGIGYDNLEELVLALSQKNTKKSLAQLELLVQQGVDSAYLSKSLIELVHYRLLRYYKDDVPPVSGFTKGQLTELLSILLRADRQIQRSVLPHIPLELAVIKYCESL